MSAVLRTLGIILLCAFGYLFLWPVPVEPVAWEAPKDRGFVDEFAPNQKLESFTRLTLGELHGPEAAVHKSDGVLYATTHEGWIIRWAQDQVDAEKWVDLGGRPLGLDFDAAGNLWVANAYSGLQKVTADGKVELVLTEVDGVALRYADDLAVTPDGKIYLSDASTRFAAEDAGGTLEASLLDILEHSDNGRVIEYDPATGASKTVMQGMTFANGVAADPAGRFILVAETGEYKVLKFWLKGDKQGQTETIIDNLPGFPDNIHTGKNGRFWVGFASPRSKPVDDLAGKPFLRKVVQRLPPFMRPQPVHYGAVFAIDEEGKVLENLQAPDGSVYTTTGVAEADEVLYVTSLTAPFLAKYQKKDLGVD